MTGLSYPFVYECKNCGEQTTIERENVKDLHGLNAREIALQRRGWARDDIKGVSLLPELRRRQHVITAVPSRGATISPALQTPLVVPPTRRK